MRFELFPILAIMHDFYTKPLSPERFSAYIKLLNGNTKDDLVMPISFFNPMAKGHILAKVEELIELNAEKVIQETIDELNTSNGSQLPNVTFRIALNIADDIKGGWTNFFTTDFDSKFKTAALFERHFCVPVFWAGETYSRDLIRIRTLEYAYRVIFWKSHPRLKTLAQHLDQELFVARALKTTKFDQPIDIETRTDFLARNSSSDNYSLIFNFFYGDEASKSLGFPLFGMRSDVTGFDYAKYYVRCK